MVEVFGRGSYKSHRHSETLTREAVISHKGNGVACNIGVNSVTFLCGMESHVYPAIAPERVVPLMKLLVEQKILILAHDGIKKLPQDWKEEEKKAARIAEYKRKKEEALMAAARRVHEHKWKAAEAAKTGAEDPYDAFLLDNEREVDVW